MDSRIDSPPPVHILLVDDSPANLLVLEHVLGGIDAVLVRATSGEEALKRVLEVDFAVIVLDVQMPTMDGLQTARLLRSYSRTRGTAIIFVTADPDADESIAEAYQQLGAVDFLTKPISPPALRSKVAVFVELHRHRVSLRAAQLRALQERTFLAAVLEAIEDGIVACDAQGTLTLFNRATRDMHGLPEEPIPPEEWSNHYRLFGPDGITPMSKEEIPLFRALSGEHVRQAGMVIQSTQGVARTLQASGRPLYDEAGNKLGAVVSMHDVTAIREATRAREDTAREQGRREAAEATADRLRGSEERLRLATEAAELGVWTWNVRDDLVTWETARIFEIFGVSPADKPINARRFMEEFIHPDDAAVFDTAIRRTLESDERFSFQGRLRKRGSGEVRWVEFTGRLQRAADGTPDRVLGTIADITDRRRAEEGMRRLATELAEMDRRKSEFLATLAHELRNPLAPIRNGLEVLKLAPGSAAASKAREMMERQLRHMVHLVDDLLDVARISNGKITLKRELVDVAALVESAVESNAPILERGKHRLSINLPPTPIRLEGDAMRLAQVLGNLIGNAAKYTPEAGHIEISARVRGGEVAICVADDGIGLASEALPMVFDMFTQVGPGIDRAQGGLGIGLSLVRALVELHAGTVEATSAGPGKGSTFTVRLPLAREGGVNPVEGGGAAIRKPPASRVLDILVVDDNVDAAESLAELLRMGGHGARVAHDGPQALESVRGAPPEAIFLDIGLPGMDGYEVARELRSTPGMERILLVALTGWGAEEDRARSAAAGFDAHLTKPAEPGEIQRLLARCAGT